MNSLLFITTDSLVLTGLIVIPVLLICKFIDNISKSNSSYSKPVKPETAEERSRRLLGDELYESQTIVLKNVVERHKCDKSEIVDITTINGIKDSAQMILVGLLPGDELQLKLSKGKDVIRVERCGVCIGHVSALHEARIKDLMADNCITGIYIHEQNSYGHYPSGYYHVKVVVYYNL